MEYFIVKFKSDNIKSQKDLNSKLPDNFRNPKHIVCHADNRSGNGIAKINDIIGGGYFKDFPIRNGVPNIIRNANFNEKGYIADIMRSTFLLCSLYKEFRSSNLAPSIAINMQGCAWIALPDKVMLSFKLTEQEAIKWVVPIRIEQMLALFNRCAWRDYSTLERHYNANVDFEVSIRPWGYGSGDELEPLVKDVMLYAERTHRRALDAINFAFKSNVVKLHNDVIEIIENR